MPGVNVQVKGTTTGTITDFDGNYSIDVPDSKSTLVFSFICWANISGIAAIQKTHTRKTLKKMCIRDSLMIALHWF